MEKKRNPTVEDNIQRAKDRITKSDHGTTRLENIDDNPYNDKITDPSEIIIRKAAKRCKVEVSTFKQELEKAEGATLQEKIENTEEELNEQFRGRTGRRA